MINCKNLILLNYNNKNIKIKLKVIYEDDFYFQFGE